jgi:hypothetical protein
MPTPAALEAPADPTREYQAAMLAIGRKLERTISDRRVNNVWEYTQSVIAIAVVVTTCGGVITLATWHPDVRMPAEWWTIVGLVIGFYFGRVRPPAAAAAPRVGTERDRRSDPPPV